MGKDNKLSFSDFFGIDKKILKQEEFFDVSLVSDLPLFIDPFHLFYSKKDEYKKCHNEIIKYLVFLKELSVTNKGILSNSIIETYYKFPEVKQNWFGFTFFGNGGHGLGRKFATALNQNFNNLFKDFGVKTQTNHLEKLTLIADRVGRDTISDFTTNLIINFLATETEKFTLKYLPKEKTGHFVIKKAFFDYSKQVWAPKTFNLPFYKNDFVLLTPRDLLTKHETWINKRDFIENFSGIPNATDDVVLREQLSSFLKQKLRDFSKSKIDKKTRKEVLVETNETKIKAAIATTLAFPIVIDIYIKLKEERGDQAISSSKELVINTEKVFENQFRNFTQGISLDKPRPNSYDEAYARIKYFKECVELKDCYLNFYNKDEPLDEDWIQRMFWFVWYGSESDINREPHNGLGEPDFKVSQGRKDKTLVEFKLAKSKTFEKNLLNQLEKYKEVEDTEKGIWVIIFFTLEEEQKVKKILKIHSLENNKNYILIDARKDNKISASKIK